VCSLLLDPMATLCGHSQPAEQPFAGWHAITPNWILLLAGQEVALSTGRGRAIRSALAKNCSQAAVGCW